MADDQNRYERGGHPSDGMPVELRSALEQSPEALDRFEQLPSSHRREYVAWVRDARRGDTRERRAAQTVMRLLDG